MNGNATFVEQSTLLQPPRGYISLSTANLILCSISTGLCVILIVAITLPLLNRKRRKECSTYNLYLAYLSIPDLLYNAFNVYLISTHTSWNLDEISGEYLRMMDHEYDFRIFIMCTSANMYINVFLTVEIYRLLKNSNKRKRHYPPTIARVTTQAIISYGLGIVVFYLNYLKYDNLPDKLKWLDGGKYDIVFTIVFVIPLSVLATLCAMIYWQGLYRSTLSMYEGRLRVLTLYFARIIVISVLIWTPCAFVYSADNIMNYGIALLFSGSQVIVSFGCSMTKPDTRKLVVKLVTFDYCRQCMSRKRDGEEEDEDSLETSFRDPYLRTRSIPRTNTNAEGHTMCLSMATDKTARFSLPTVQSEEIFLDGQSRANLTSDGSNKVVDSRNQSNNTPHLSAEITSESNNGDRRLAEEP